MKKIFRIFAAIALIVAQLPLSIFAANKENNTTISDIIICSDETTLQENSECAFDFNVPKDGKYNLSVTYKCEKGKSISPLLGIAFDNQNAKSDDLRYTLPRIWQTKNVADGSKRFDQDSEGNELAPSQEEKFESQTMVIPLSADNTIKLSAGVHKLRLYMALESVKIEKIALAKPYTYEKYNNYIKKYKAGNVKGAYMKREAELVTTKSDLNIVTTFDRSLPSISPSSPDKIRYNILGGSSWSKEGQWVSWNINIEKEGLYNFDVVYRQNILDGISVRRRIYIDGKVPFEEMDCVEFPYAKDFTSKTLSDDKGNPYEFYFSKGTHTVRMEVVLGEAKSILKEFRSTIYEMNSLYNKINIIVGNQTDIYRDYDFDESIPGLIDSLNKQADQIDKAIDYLDGTQVSGGSQTARMKEALRLLKKFANNPDSISGQLEYFRTQINTMSDVLASMMTQPIDLDYFVLRSSDREAEKVSNGFFDYIAFRSKAFLASFTSSYNTKGNKPNGNKNSLKVWVSSNDLAVAGFSSGRDQAQIIDQMVTNDFSAKNNIDVKVSLVSAADTLMQAVASGRGPDVVLLTPKNIIANLYYRGALVDLKQLPNYDKIINNYYPSSLISLQSDGKLYALPEIQMFNMLFYRKDIFKQQDLTPPKTWDEFYKTVFRLQNAGLQVGITESQLIFEMFLLQNGSTLYNKELSATRLKQKASVDAFTSWTDLYSKYGLPLSFDMLNRFRTGQMPMTIAPYYFYNQVSVSAPEIENLWSIAPIPGIVNSDGTINNSESCSVSGSIVLKKKSDNYDSAFKFVEWWAETDVQNDYAFECETRVGISARYSPANKQTLSTIAWTKDEYDALSSQWANVSDIPQTPATYFVTRNLSNAYRRVVYDYENPRDVIYRYAQDIDNELTRKREELGIGK